METFSKVGSMVALCMKISSELSFENFHQWGGWRSGSFGHYLFNGGVNQSWHHYAFFAHAAIPSLHRADWPGVCGCINVCVCVCVRMCVCVRDRERERERERVCVCEREREQERDRESVCVCVCQCVGV